MTTPLAINAKHEPLVSIGLPVFNGEKLVALAIESIIAQTHGNLELIISDNHSSDKTSNICKAFAAKDSRIKYFRQPENIGARLNFCFVLEQARGQYFFWAACDDVRSEDFIKLNVEFLETNLDYCSSISQVRDEGGNFNPRRMGDKALNQENYENKILAYFNGWHRNAIIYSIYRREAMVNHPIAYGPEHLALDWTMIMHTAKHGHMQRLEQGELVLGKGGASKGIRHLRTMRKRRIEYFFPHWELCMYLKEISKDFSLRARIILFIRAVTLNIRANLMRLIHVFEA
jgi:glycosyltransferase involved in cell wall biosynthesis